MELQRFPQCIPGIGVAAGMLMQAFSEGHKLLLCGNGGSASQCQHMAAEFVSGLYKDRPRRALPAISLTTDTSVLTASANDYGYAGVFTRQVEAHGKRGDILLAISTSGESENLMAAAARAKRMGLCVIALTGPKDSTLAKLANLTIHAPGENVQRIQESQLVISHLLCEIVELLLFSGGKE